MRQLRIYYNPQQKINCKYYFISTFLGILILISFVVTMYFSIVLITADQSQLEELLNKESKDQQSIISQEVIKYLVITSLSLNALPVFFNIQKSLELLCSLPSYFYYSPSYINLLVIYAFCRIDDLSWGTKGLAGSSGQDDDLQSKFKWRKFVFVSQWFVSNVMIVIVFKIFISERIVKELFIYLMAGLNIGLLSLRSIGALIYYLYYYLYFRQMMRQARKEYLSINSQNSEENRVKLQRFFKDEEFENYRRSIMHK